VAIAVADTEGAVVGVVSMVKPVTVTATLSVAVAAAVAVTAVAVSPVTVLIPY
jgi:hypothetical protein